MDLGKEDLKHILNLSVALSKKCSFKDLSGPEVLSVALSLQWLGELKAKIEDSLKPAPKEAQVEPLKSEMKQTKKTKK